VGRIDGGFAAKRAGALKTAALHEALAKVLAYNICVLVRSIHELGIEPDF